MVFAVSTFLYRHKRLTRDQLMEIAAHGFTCVELFASRLHVDYHNATVVADVQQYEVRILEMVRKPRRRHEQGRARIARLLRDECLRREREENCMSNSNHCTAW